MDRFQPRRPDGKPEWRVIFDLVHEAPHGRLFMMSEFTDALETKDLPRVYRAVGRTNRELWKRSNRSLSSLRNVGYKVLRPQEHEEQAIGFQAKARRKMGQAVSVMKATDLAGLSDSERDRNLRVAALLVNMVRTVDWHCERLNRHDDLIRELAERVDRLEEKKED